jgi:hypothetical protein
LIYVLPAISRALSLGASGRASVSTLGERKDVRFSCWCLTALLNVVLQLEYLVKLVSSKRM